jgi:cytochrome c2
VGREKIRAYGCGSCDTVPGVRSAGSMVGSPLTGIGGRMYIAGILANTPDHMEKWIQDPPAIDSATAMPDVGVTARDEAAATRVHMMNAFGDWQISGEQIGRTARAETRT